MAGGSQTPHRGGTITALGISSLVLSILGMMTTCFSCVPFLIVLPLLFILPGLGLGIAAWAMASGDLKDIAAGVMSPAGQASTTSGMTCAIVGVILNGLALVGCGFTTLLILGAAAG